MILENHQKFASPEEALKHYGVKGMKWGVRKERTPKEPLTGYVKKPITRTTKNGDTFTLTPRVPRAVRALGGIGKIRSGYNATSSSLRITDKNGTKIGHASFTVKNKNDIHLSVIKIEKSARGRGYATEILKAAVEHGKTTGHKRLILQVPDTARDAHHIYEKLGFKETGKAKLLGTPVTNMEYRFDD